MPHSLHVRPAGARSAVQVRNRPGSGKEIVKTKSVRGNCGRDSTIPSLPASLRRIPIEGTG